MAAARTTAEPARLPRGRSLGLGERARLIGEVVTAYARARRELRQVPIDGPEALEEAARLGRIVVRTLAFLPGDTRCLRRSLVLTQLLARRGISGRLVIGARTAPDFLAHAWVEHDGIPVLSPEGDSFGRLVEL
jgi:transglutaminase superfamily protein